MNENRNISQQKKLLRKKFIQQRQKLSEQEWHLKNQKICEHLLTNDLLKKAQIILSYISFKKEPNLSYLYLNHQCLWGFPRCQQNNLIWHQWQWGDKLAEGNYGIKEPLSTAPLIDINTVNLILVPAVACDFYGYRLGYGGGYYDQMLANLTNQNIPTIGIVFDFAYVPELIKEKWDQPLNYICTEKGINKTI